jgi:RNA polymerase sigma factor (sigma-70 family)
MTEGGTTVLVERWLKVLPEEDPLARQNARDELIEHSRRRMQALCRTMFYSSLRGSVVDWEDIYQEAALRVWNSLDEVRPATMREFFGLAATQIRRVLIDKCRKFLKDPPPPDCRAAGDSAVDPESLTRWTEFHQSVEKLADKQREVVELLWYNDLTQTEAAEVLQVDASTVKRRWRAARLELATTVADII